MHLPDGLRGVLPGPRSYYHVFSQDAEVKDLMNIDHVRTYVQHGFMELERNIINQTTRAVFSEALLRFLGGKQGCRDLCVYMEAVMARRDHAAPSLAFKGHGYPADLSSERVRTMLRTPRRTSYEPSKKDKVSINVPKEYRKTGDFGDVYAELWRRTESWLKPAQKVLDKASHL